MRPPRLLLLLFCFVFLPILLTCLSLISGPRHDGPENASLAGRTSRFRAFFSFNAPSSLFPPSAIISLTDDNSTFFLARPAAFGPLLPAKGLSGELWVGSGFGDETLPRGGSTADADGELGCSDVPGWAGKDGQLRQDRGSNKESERNTNTNGADVASSTTVNRRNDPAQESGEDGGSSTPPSADDGTDDHLHHPLPNSELPGTPNSEASGKQPAHADIQSLQESAEIAGKVVLLSRGGCGFLEKVKWVQRRGGVALIVGDDTRGGSLVTMYARGDTSNVTIPAVFTSHTTAHLLSSLIPGRDRGNSDAGLKFSHKGNNGKSSAGKAKSRKQGSKIPPTSAPTSSSDSTSKGPLAESSGSSDSKTGFLHSLLSLLGFGNDNGYPWHLPEDSRRPPSSGSIDWVLVDDWEEEETSKKAKSADAKDRSKNTGAQLSDSKSDGKSGTSDGDDFVIGVQDWRDPDLVPPKRTQPDKKLGKTDLKSSVDDKPESEKKPKTGSNLKGGSTTPGSGEYIRPDKGTSFNKGSSNDVDNEPKSKPEKSEKSWLSRYLGWLHGAESDSHRSAPVPDGKADNLKDEVREKSEPGEKPGKGGEPDLGGHEGLWVTLTPTNMSTSPFFDTLLVLVVSPLITLTVVYALLLLRSRIRRRRWRAPKSVVDRLPVRTYHTMPSYSSSSSSPRSPSPGSSSTSPLLIHRPHSISGRSRPRSRTTSGVVNTMETAKEANLSGSEKPIPGSTLWRRKYTGRQVECVVCLEEYIDGQSRVMSLPCGHEFHADCITPWLTTRRRTCPICKGDVVRSMSHMNLSGIGGREQSDQAPNDTHSHNRDHQSDVRPVMIPISERVGGVLDAEQGDDPDALSSVPHSNWRSFGSSSFSALSGDTIWHQARADRNR